MFADNKDSEKLAALEAEVFALRGSIKDHSKLLLGNGRHGLVQEMAHVSTEVQHVGKTVAQIQANTDILSATVERLTSRVELFTTRTESFVESIHTGGQAFQRRVLDLEKLVRPLIDWKKGIYLRMATILATCGVIFSVLWFFVEHKDLLKGLFK